MQPQPGRREYTTSYLHSPRPQTQPGTARQTQSHAARHSQGQYSYIPRTFAWHDPRPQPTHQEEHQRRRRRQQQQQQQDPSASAVEYDVPFSYRNLDEVRDPPPVQNIDEPEIFGLSRNDGHPLRQMTRGQRSYSIPASIPESHCPTPNREPLLPRTSSQDQGLRRLWTDSAAGPAQRAPLKRNDTRDSRQSRSSWDSESRSERNERRASRRSSVNYDVPDSWLNLGEVSDTGPVQNVDEDHIYRYRSLEDARERDQEYIHDRAAVRSTSSGEGGAPEDPQEKQGGPEEVKVSRYATQLYTISYLIFFSLLGTLARLGLQVLTNYAGAPVFPSVWYNFGGSVVMGFLSEDRMLFRDEWGTPKYEREIQRFKDAENGGMSDGATVDLVAAKKAHNATKKTIPLYIGLATGFCGSFTSFSAFIRDIFLAMSNDLTQPGSSTTGPRSGGYSFMALVAVIIVTVSASLSGLFVGAHLAIASEPIIPSLPYPFMRKIGDRLAVLLGWGCWAAAIVLAVIPPHAYWRGDALFSLVFAPVGCLGRFYISLLLNGRRASFPLGTFAVNVFGTAVLGMGWSLQRVPIGGVIGCQLLQGVEDGFCGCLTTVSTWVSELAALRRVHAWIYGTASVLVSFGVMVAIMGGLRWTDGWAALQCVH